MISAASHQLIFLAIAFNSTSCNFIIRSVSAAEYCWGAFPLQLLPPLFQTGQFTCEFNRTDHILATAPVKPFDRKADGVYSRLRTYESSTGRCFHSASGSSTGEFALFWPSVHG